jgi:hypothetical protein
MKTVFIVKKDNTHPRSLRLHAFSSFESACEFVRFETKITILPNGKGAWSVYKDPHQYEIVELDIRP